LGGCFAPLAARRGIAVGTALPPGRRISRAAVARATAATSGSALASALATLDSATATTGAALGTAAATATPALGTATPATARAAFTAPAAASVRSLGETQRGSGLGGVAGANRLERLCGAGRDNDSGEKQCLQVHLRPYRCLRL
jgi:hypothetical protein